MILKIIVNNYHFYVIFVKEIIILKIYISKLFVVIEYVLNV